MSAHSKMKVAHHMEATWILAIAMQNDEINSY
jgi:hypothetical protein